MLFIIGAANTVIDLGKDTNSYLILILSMIMLWTTMYFWFKQVQENHAGLNNPMLKDSYVYGMVVYFLGSHVLLCIFLCAGLHKKLYPGLEEKAKKV